MRTFVVSCLVVLALSGCAGSGPPLPTYDDAFKGLYNQSAATVPADVPVRVQHPVGIILSDNVEAYIGWVKKSKEYWASVVPASLTNNVAIADSDPDYIASQFLTMLKRHFPEAQVVKDFNAAVGTGKKAVLLVDIRTVPGIGGQTTTVDATAYVFDAGMTPVSKMSAHAATALPFMGGSSQIQPTTDAAVQQLDAKITALVR
jgi:hypothetical protein